jgi:hypothetical protein
MEEMYKKIIIESEKDLPKEDGWYFVAGKNTLKTSGIKPKIFTVISKDVWLSYVAWYLQPLPHPREVTDLKMPEGIVAKMQKEFQPTTIRDFEQGMYSGYGFGLVDGFNLCRKQMKGTITNTEKQ